MQFIVTMQFAFSIKSMCFDKPNGIAKYPLSYPIMGFYFTEHACVVFTSLNFLQHLTISDLFIVFVFPGISCIWCHTECRISALTLTIQKQHLRNHKCIS